MLAAHADRFFVPHDAAVDRPKGFFHGLLKHTPRAPRGEDIGTGRWLGLGEDTADYTGASSAITVNLYAGSAMDGDGGVDTLISIENVIGSDHADVITGNDRDNIIVGGEGADVLIGGDGADQFFFGGLSETGDMIEDFLSGTDTVVLDANAFVLTAGDVIEGENFSVITGAFDGTDAGDNSAFTNGDAALVYSEEDAALYYDSNGSAQDGYSVVATFTGGTRLAEDDVHLTSQGLA